MGAIMILFGYLICGTIIANHLFSGKCMLIRLWLGLCAGLMLMMWLPAIYAFFLDFTLTATLLGLVTAAVGAAILCLKHRPEPSAAAFCGSLPPKLLSALMIPAVLVSAYLQYTHILRDVNGAMHVGQSTYGDLCLHLGIATSLRNAPFPPLYSILPGARLGYPFLGDSMVTSMLLCGGDLKWSFVITGTLMMALVYLGFIIFAWKLTKKRSAVALAFVLMFLNGGLGFLYTFDGAFKDPTMLREVFTGFYRTPANMPELNLRWVNVICDMMVPQRTLLCGWTVLLPALYMFIEAEHSKRAKDYALLGVWAGLIPMVHTHSFFALGLMSVGAMAHRLLYSPADERRGTLLRYLIYGSIALVLALPQLLTWTFPQTIDGGSLNLRFNWVNNQGDGRLIDGYFWFWIKNVGLVYLFMLPAALSAKKSSLLRTLSWGALAIYAVAELIQFQPNPYDNNKLFYVAYMLMLPSVALYLTKLWSHLRGVRCAALFACLFIAASTLSGGLSLAREIVSDYQLFSAEEARAAEYIEAELPADAIFLTGDQHCNAVAALTGRSIVCGTASYLFYHGIDYSAQRDAQARMLASPADNLALFDEYDVDYIYISSYEQVNFSADTGWFEENCAKIYDSRAVRIYEHPQ